MTRIEENTTNRATIFKERHVDDYLGFIEGDYEASLGKTIKILIIASKEFIVYLDQELSVQWTYNDSYDCADIFLEKFGLIVSKISLLEELSAGKLSGNKLSAVRRLLGESLGRLLDEKNDKNALFILNSAEELINAQNRQTLIISASILSAIIFIAEIVLWSIFMNSPLASNFVKIYPLILCSLGGGIGAYLFLMIRSKTIPIEASLDKKKYICEGALRIGYGILCGFLAYLAINSKLFFGNIENPRLSIITFLICVISGASEKIIPGIIKKIEDKI